MIKYDKVERKLNEQVKTILILIKNDYYIFMSPAKRKVLDELISCEQIVVVNKGISHFRDNTLAHGGRALKDGKIHFYPDVRNFNTDEAIEYCIKILPHECFHYFIQPDNIKLQNRLEKEMANFYTEGLVERETRIFGERHKEELSYSKANYGYNINFVNMLQNRLNASSYEIIFSEDDYIKNIGNYIQEYRAILEQKEHNLEVIKDISRSFPIDIQRKVLNKMRNMILQDGNAKAAKERLKTFEFVSDKSIQQLDTISDKEIKERLEI